jgi:hypothetical protein
VDETVEIYPLDEVVTDKRMVIGRIGAAGVDHSVGLVVMVPDGDETDVLDSGRIDCGRLALVVFGEEERLALVLKDSEARKLIVDLAQYYAGVVAFESLREGEKSGS